jgi:hypothetical protein
LMAIVGSKDEARANLTRCQINLFLTLKFNKRNYEMKFLFFKCPAFLNYIK